MNKENYFLSQPHQPFFILGIFNAIIMMLVFALSYKGIFILDTGIVTFHVYSLVYLVFTNLFIGFLFTTFPRFNQTKMIERTFYTRIFYINIISSLLFLIGSFVSLAMIITAMILVLISQILTILKLKNIYNTSTVTDKNDSFWILIANYFGLIANVLFIISELFSQTLQASAVNIAFYMYLIFLAFSVGQRMIPFFSNSFVQKNPKFIQVIFILFFALTFFNIINIKSGTIIIDLLLTFYTLREFLRWKLHPLRSPAIVWILQLGLFWLPTAFFLSAVSLIIEVISGRYFYFLGIHMLALGFLTTVLIGFATRVALGHARRVPTADKLTTYIFYFTQVLVITRALYSVNVAYSWGLNFLFDISFSAWLLLFVVWGIKYAKIIMFYN